MTASHTPERSTFNFDGRGINGPDEYRSRLATFTDAGNAYPGLGPLLAAAPETAAERDRLREVNADLIAALEGLEPMFCNDGPLLQVYATEIAQARAAIAKATLPCEAPLGAKQG